ncbi:MAG TPA: ATP-binding protein [Gammaproteobacteria bacterium]|nr:ATP-binding protein [Gammaproteobacteria bacterium]
MNSTANDTSRFDELEARLREAEETLDAIRNGEVDAVVVGPADRQQVYTLESPDRPYRLFVEQIQEGAVTLSAEGTILYCNRRFAEMLAMPQEQVTGGSINRFILAEQKGRFEQLLDASAAGGSREEFDLVAGDGTLMPAYLSLVELAREPTRRVCGIVMDLTQQRQAEQRHRAAEESLQIALEASGMGHWNADLVAGTTHRSPSCDAIFGREPNLPWNRDIFIDHVHPEDRDTVAKRLEALGDGDRLELECRIRRRDNDAVRWIRLNGKVYYDDGKPVRAAGVVADITAWHQLEEQFHQAQKMEAVGQLTGGLAHDFNNLLAVIVSSLGIAQRRLSKADPTLARQLNHAEQAAHRGAALTRQLLSFSRRQSLLPRVVCINDLLDDLEPLIRGAVDEKVDVRIDTGDSACHCRIDPNQLESAILNLAINARDAMAGSGTLRVEARAVELSATNMESLSDAPPGQYVKLSVVDTGMGMAPEVQSRIFDPFFTTKEIGKGSGLGLSMVYGFVKQSNGHIEIDSEIGRGTAIHLYLPWAEQPVVAAKPDTDRLNDNSQSVLVLVVEDDPHVRSIVVDLVRDLGHSVIEAANATDALKAIEERSDVNFLFTDIVMPGGMSGTELAREARRRRPQLAVLLTTGFTTESLSEGPNSGERFHILQKPYARSELVTAIEAALAQTHEPVSQA